MQTPPELNVQPGAEIWLWDPQPGPSLLPPLPASAWLCLVSRGILAVSWGVTGLSCSGALSDCPHCPDLPGDPRHLGGTRGNHGVHRGWAAQ